MSIYYSSGNKGGTSKSMVAAVLADHRLACGRQVAIVEGDIGQPDIALRFKSVPGVHLRATNLNRSGASEEAVIKFAEALADLPTDADIIVNLPSAAADTMDALAPMLVDAGRDLGHESYVFYALGHQQTATDSALQSLREGLMAAVPPDHLCLIYPLFLQPDIECFHFVRSGARDAYIEAGGLEGAMPALRPESLVDKVLSLPGTFTALAQPDSALSFGERLFFGRQWLPAAHAAVAVLTEGTSHG